MLYTLLVGFVWVVFALLLILFITAGTAYAARTTLDQAFFSYVLPVGGLLPVFLFLCYFVGHLILYGE